MLVPTDAMLKNKDKWAIDDDSGRFVALANAPADVIKDVDELNRLFDEAENNPEMVYDL